MALHGRNFSITTTTAIFGLFSRDHSRFGQVAQRYHKEPFRIAGARLIYRPGDTWPKV